LDLITHVLPMLSLLPSLEMCILLMSPSAPPSPGLQPHGVLALYSELYKLPHPPLPEVLIELVFQALRILLVFLKRL
jgi:hypothetical protein